MTGSFIELLLEEAPADAFYERLRHAEREFEDADELERLHEEFAAAMRLRSKMERQRQREAELSALYETANDLAAIRDVDAVLSAIVRRARRLFAADVAYLALNDPERGDAYIRTTEGSQAAGFRTLRLPMGRGLIGLVAQTATPYSSDDYPGDDRFAHLDYVDEAVANEGIRGVLGVPLILNGQVTGALLVAKRIPRPFSHDDVALLESLAAHAAIALESARLFEETRTALRELNDVSAEVRAHSESLELAASAHDRLADVLLRGGGVADVAGVLADVLAGAVWVFDPDGYELAVAGGESGACGASLAETVAEALDTGRTVEVETSSDQLRLVAVARAGSDHLGTVVLGRQAALGDVDRRIVERAAVVTALLLMFQRSVAQAEDRVRGELLDDLLSAPHRDADLLSERARRYGADLDLAHVVTVIHADGVERHRVGSVAAQLATKHHGLAGLRGDDVVLVIPGDTPMPSARDVAERLRAALAGVVTVGVAGPAIGPVEIAEAYQGARQCLATLIALGRHGDVADAAALGLASFLLGRSNHADVEEYLQRTLGPVLDYDSRRGTQLAATLDAWFAAGGSLSEAGKRLHIHANTVGQRLERVTALLGDDWRDPQRALETQLALTMWRMRNADVP